MTIIIIHNNLLIKSAHAMYVLNNENTMINKGELLMQMQVYVLSHDLFIISAI